HAARRGSRSRVPGKDDVPVLVEFRAERQADLIRLPAKQHRIDRLHEGVHAVEPFRSGTGRQPVEIAIGTRDVAIRARGNVNDDLAARPHTATKLPATAARSNCSTETSRWSRS